MSKTIDEILIKYYDEADGGMVDSNPSDLRRGEGTDTEFYIMKIDLCRSTMFFRNKNSRTYLKIAHTFLSTVDEITRYYGADANQAEYAGDSVIAYFKASNAEPLDVLLAAYLSQLAALKMQNLDPTLKLYHFKTKTVLHYGKLIMAKIGPWGDVRVSAIGFELHRVCNMEKFVGPGQGKATKEFYGKLKPVDRKFLTANTIPKQEAEVVMPAVSPFLPREPAILYSGLRNSLTSVLYGLSNAHRVAIPPKPAYEMKTEIVDYSVNWERIKQYLQKER